MVLVVWNAKGFIPLACLPLETAKMSAEGSSEVLNGFECSRAPGLKGLGDTAARRCTTLPILPSGLGGQWVLLFKGVFLPPKAVLHTIQD